MFHVLSTSCDVPPMLSRRRNVSELPLWLVGTTWLSAGQRDAAEMMFATHLLFLNLFTTCKEFSRWLWDHGATDSSYHGTQKGFKISALIKRRLSPWITAWSQETFSPQRKIYVIGKWMKELCLALMKSIKLVEAAFTALAQGRLTAVISVLSLPRCFRDQGSVSDSGVLF